MNVMNRMFYALCALALIGLISCSDDKDDDIVGNPYVFKDISYFPVEDTVKTIEESGAIPVVVENRKGGSVATVTSDPYQNSYNTSSFESDDALLHDFFRDSILVQVPVYIDGQDISLGEPGWIIADMEKKEPAGHSSDITEVPVGVKATILYYVKKKVYTAGFKLIYEDKKSGAEKELEGTWQGSYIYGFRKEVKTEP